MHRLAIVTIATLLASATLMAQRPSSNANSAVIPSGGFGTAGMENLSGEATPKADSAQKQAPGVVLRSVPSAAGCPVSMRAQQRGWGDMMEVNRKPGDAPATPGVAQRIHLTLAGAPDSASIREAKVAVQGTSNKSRSIHPQLTQDGLSNKTKTLDVAFSENGNSEASADLLLRGFTSVQSITLESVTYSDGSTWMPSAGKSCRTAPDPMMLIAAH